MWINIWRSVLPITYIIPQTQDQDFYHNQLFCITRKAASFNQKVLAEQLELLGFMIMARWLNIQKIQLHRWKWGLILRFTSSTSKKSLPIKPIKQRLWSIDQICSFFKSLTTLVKLIKSFHLFLCLANWCFQFNRFKRWPSKVSSFPPIECLVTWNRSVNHPSFIFRYVLTKLIAKEEFHFLCIIYLAILLFIWFNWSLAKGIDGSPE